MRHIDQRLGTPAPVLRIRADKLQPIPIDPPCQTVPERVLDHSRETVHGVLHQSGFIQDDSLPAVISSQSELLKQVGKHVVTLQSNNDAISKQRLQSEDSKRSHPDIKRLVGVGTGCAERNQLWPGIVSGNLWSKGLVSLCSVNRIGCEVLTWKSLSVSSCSRTIRKVSSTSIKNRLGARVDCSSCDSLRFLDGASSPANQGLLFE